MAKPLEEKRYFNIFPKGPLVGFLYKENYAMITGPQKNVSNEHSVIINDNRVLKISTESKKKSKNIKPSLILL